MNLEHQRKIDEIMYETNNKINAIVYEIRQIKFSQLNEEEKKIKCDRLREEFEKTMIEEEKRIEEIIKTSK